MTAKGPHTYVLCAAHPEGLSTFFLNELTELLTRLGLSLTDLNVASPNQSCLMSLHAESPGDPTTIKLALMDLSNKYRIDLALMRDDQYQRPKKLIVFDMDSTLIRQEVIDEMATAFGIGDQVKKITHRAMNGELRFDEALRERVALCKGLKRSAMEKILARLEFTPGTEALMKTAKVNGIRTALVSGGFSFFANEMAGRLGMDYVYSNELEWNGDELSGRVIGTVINAEKKAELIETLAKQEGITLEETVAVGDGANDLLMLAKAGIGIGFHAKEKVRREAPHLLSHGPMTTLLYFLGITGNHFHETV